MNVKKEYVNVRDVWKMPRLVGGSSASIFRDGDFVIKLYDDDYLYEDEYYDINTEKKILRAKKIENLPEILIPESAVYNVDTGKFIGTRSSYVDGISYIDFLDGKLGTINNSDIVRNYDLFESIFKRADVEGIIFPDFNSGENIFFVGDRSSYDIKLIDYDGIQFEKDKTLVVSSSLLSSNLTNNSKRELIFSEKYFKDKVFTRELNVYSEYVLFFLDLLNIDMTKMCHKIGLDGFFQNIGLDDYDLQDKIYKLFKSSECNEYLGDDKYKVIDKYDIKVIGKFREIEVKKLVRKK
jgi:hypothetical protein